MNSEKDMRIQGALNRLDAHERYLVEYRIMVQYPLSLGEIGRQLGLTREQARLLEISVKEKLKGWI